VNVVCPKCDQVNRVDAAKLDKHPSCGVCGGDLITNKPVTLDTSGLKKNVEKGGLPLLVDFWAPWCGPCKMMAPAFEDAARHLAPKVRLAKIDTQQNRDAAETYRINSIPTLIIFKNGREITRVSGAMSADKIISFVKSHVAV